MVFITAMLSATAVYFMGVKGFAIAFTFAVIVEVINNMILMKTVRKTEERLRDSYKGRLEKYLEREEKFIQIIKQYKLLKGGIPELELLKENGPSARSANASSPKGTDRNGAKGNDSGKE